MPMSSPMMTTMFGRCPAATGGDAAGCCCACAGLVSPTADSAEAATSEPPLNSKAGRFNPALFGPEPVSDGTKILSLLMTDPLPGDAPEADMACRSVDRLGMTRGRTIAATVIWRTEMRAAFKHLARNPDVRLTRVVACG